MYTTKFMRILYLTQFFSSTRGGGPLIFYDLAKALSERGHKLYIICNLATETIDSENIRIFTVKPLLSNTYELPTSPTQNLRYIVNSVVSGAKIAKEYNIEVIHTNSLTPVIAGSILSKLKRIPMIASIYAVFTSADSNSWKKWAHYNNLPHYYSIIPRTLEQLSLRMPFDLIHTISESTREDILLQKGNRHIRVIYPAINDNEFKYIEPTYDNFILYIGRLVFYKNVDVLIRAYAEVIKELPTAKLIVVGEGPMEQEWKDLSRSLGISNNIIFTKHLAHQDKMKLLARCSALALPSIFEGFGLVILEAFATGKPVLVANVSPFDEIVDQDINGFLLTYNAPHEWAKAIIMLLSNRQLCQAMGNNAQKKLIEKFDFRKYIETMESLYLEIGATS